MDRAQAKRPPSPQSGPSLSGWTVLITRPTENAEPVLNALRQAGSSAVSTPAIEFSSLVEGNRERLDSLLRRLRDEAGWLVLPSPNAIRSFFEALGSPGRGPDPLGSVRLATIGAGSARALASHGRRPDFESPRPTGAALAQALPAKTDEPVGIVGSAQSRPELRQGLAARGLSVEFVPIYETIPSASGLARLRRRLEDLREARGGSLEKPKAILLVGSPSAVDAIAESTIHAEGLLEGVVWVAIGPTTRQRLDRLSLASGPVIESASPEPEMLVQAAREAVAAAEARPS